MKNTLLRTLIFLLVNVLLFRFHFWVFRGPYPFAGWATGLLHIILLILFPYANYFKK